MKYSEKRRSSLIRRANFHILKAFTFYSELIVFGEAIDLGNIEDFICSHFPVELRIPHGHGY